MKNLKSLEQSLQSRITSHRERAREIEGDAPQHAHDLREAAAAAMRELDAIRHTLEHLTEIQRILTRQMDALAALEITTPNITLALRHLEDAESRLMRETHERP